MMVQESPLSVVLKVLGSAFQLAQPILRQGVEHKRLSCLKWSNAGDGRQGLQGLHVQGAFKEGRASKTVPRSTICFACQGKACGPSGAPWYCQFGSEAKQISDYHLWTSERCSPIPFISYLITIDMPILFPFIPIVPLFLLVIVNPFS